MIRFDVGCMKTSEDERLPNKSMSKELKAENKGAGRVKKIVCCWLKRNEEIKRLKRENERERGRK